MTPYPSDPFPHIFSRFLPINNGRIIQLFWNVMISPFGACWDLSLVIVLEAKKGARVDSGETQHCLARHYLKGDHYWITPWAGVEGLFLPAKKTWQVEGLDVSIFNEICLHSICLHSHVQDSIFYPPTNAPHFLRGHSARLGVQFAL